MSVSSSNELRARRLGRESHRSSLDDFVPVDGLTAFFILLGGHHYTR